MRVTVVGCGALGGLFAAGLLEAGCEVQILQRRGRHFDQLAGVGLVLRAQDGGLKTFHPFLSDREDQLMPSDLVLVTVKAYETCSVARQVSVLLKQEGWAVTLQNGLGNAETLARETGAARVALGPCTYGAFLDEDGVVHKAGEGDLSLGALVRGRDITTLAAPFQEAGFRVSLLKDPFPALWAKLVINAGINPLTALVRCLNGDLERSPDLKEAMRQLVLETVAVARAEGIPLEEVPSWERCLEVCRRTASNRSSMLQDVEAGRRTEIEAISGQVVCLGRKHSIPVPVTEAIWHLLRGVDSLARQ